MIWEPLLSLAVPTVFDNEALCWKLCWLEGVEGHRCTDGVPSFTSRAQKKATGCISLWSYCFNRREVSEAYSLGYKHICRAEQSGMHSRCGTDGWELSAFQRWVVTLKYRIFDCIVKGVSRGLWLAQNGNLLLNADQDDFIGRRCPEISQFSISNLRNGNSNEIHLHKINSL